MPWYIVLINWIAVLWVVGIIVAVLVDSVGDYLTGGKRR